VFLLRWSRTGTAGVGTGRTPRVSDQVVVVAAFASLGAVSGTTMLASACSVPALVLGGMVGSQVRPLLSPERSRQLALLLLTVAGTMSLLSLLFL
jgi:hypothetical protein